MPPSFTHEEGCPSKCPRAATPGWGYFWAPLRSEATTRPALLGGLEHPTPPRAEPPRGEGKPLRHHVTRPRRRGPARSSARPRPSGRRAPVARKCPGSGRRRGERGRGARRGGPAPYVAAFLPPASRLGPVSPRRGSAPSSRRSSQWRGGASLSGRGRGVRAGPGAPAPCRPPLAVRRRWRRRRLGESEQRAGPRSVSEGAEPPARPPPPPLRKQEPGPGPGTPPQPLPRRQAARAARASQGEGERASERAPGGGGRTERAPARVA